MAKEKKQDINKESEHLEKDELEEGVDNAPTMEDILQSIRGVISGEEENESEDDDEDVLELTEMVEEDRPINEKENTESDADDSEGTSVLDDIDNALKDDPKEENNEEESPEEEEPVAEQPDEISEKEPENTDNSEENANEETEENDVFESAEVKASPEDNATKEDEEDAFEATEAPEEKVKAPTKLSEKLIEDEVASQSSETLKRLVDNIPKTHISSPYTTGGTTLEQLTIEAMRPFLSEWLNENLPTIVKQIVTKEIRKLIPEEEDK
ncbi:MAG: hypothetical protein COV35_02200 [Alphaproteobacteria bacterium CG11_big_fil_rev_8_21_14_0_20_39_49]|nr:MAG: hypothetical protein COV35_02200 [Alphaproteobacteria bacterium CG11_big_fil_rev_8_21_14_0_20_39_49]